MTTFEFHTTKSIVVERGSAARLATHIADMNCQSVLVISDQGVIGAGLLTAMLANIEQSDIAVSVYSEVVADPPESVVERGILAARAYRADCIVGLGGGSSLDTAKLIALLGNSDQSLADVYGVDAAKGQRLPLVLIPTTAGTGSEVTGIAIVTTGENEKKGVVSPLLLPDIALLDAELTVGLPNHVTAATGIDAMVHAIEAFTSKRLKNPISDSLAKDALRLLAANIQIVCQQGNNIQARENMLIGSCLAGMAFANAPVGGVHALAYPIGALFHVPHGLSNALMLNAVMRFNLPEAESEYAELANVVFPTLQGSAQERALALINYLKDLASELGIATSLREVGIDEKDLTALAEDAMKQARLLINNPREICLADAKALYKESL
ncbi:Long-chain-alcohol dehydrogenase 1 [Zhongshania aliphaticivorans]|uniref:Long-chain-alcohol dehydrogenase 1 n=1 Tax=Zhongshania aliphaticivorans TaxID=1470434 RepID=A0A5S9NSX5_9GAMM|nr:iron-containing alcohol dehydrogenase [Zhongshania aliphaticivorans]CAA0093667.1 Long-chain-alcohol dehydrogenase 1 [Zhongshania aliphaticivorans]CAA0111671.1 Long-chain-alcohol dehydrogenase 1 [Zhongshania aliphaticivorans]